MYRILNPAEWAAIKAIVPRPRTYQIDASNYTRTQSGAIIRREEKPMSRRDRIRANVEPKNRFPLRAPALNRFCQYETR